MLVFIIIALTIAFLFWKCYDLFTYWKRRGVPQKSFFDVLKTNWKMLKNASSLGDIIDEECKQFPNLRYFGAYEYFKPTLVLRTPDIIKQITVKDFDHFMDHSFFDLDDVDPIWSKNLLALKGEKWRDMRTTLSPTFTSSKMRSMFVLISECAENLANHLASDPKSVEQIEMKDIFTRYANDVIASTAFGIHCDSISKRDNEFYLKGKEATSIRGVKAIAKILILIISPTLFRFLRLKIIKSSSAKFFTKLIKETIEFREKEGIVRPDMLHLLIEARNGRLKYDEQKENDKETGFATVGESFVGKRDFGKKFKLTDTDISAQAMIFFIAGFDTVSTAMSFMAYELAVNSEVQNRLYQEISNTYSDCNENLTYETILKMKYLDMVVSETLRKWPPQVTLNRDCTKSYIIQPADKNEQLAYIDRGTPVMIPQFGIHRNEEYYPSPELFNPERFSDDNKKNIDPYAYMPFGLGPRNCVGSRFALLELKAVFVHLLLKFEMVVAAKTVVPLQYRKKQFTLKTQDGLWVGLKPRI